MTVLKTPDNKAYDTKDLPPNVELIFCAADDCAQRFGSYNSSFSDQPVVYCEECTARLANGEIGP